MTFGEIVGRQQTNINAFVVLWTIILKIIFQKKVFEVVLNTKEMKKKIITLIKNRIWKPVKMRHNHCPTIDEILKPNIWSNGDLFKQIID